MYQQFLYFTHEAHLDLVVWLPQKSCNHLMLRSEIHEIIYLSVFQKIS